MFKALRDAWSNEPNISEPSEECLGRSEAVLGLGGTPLFENRVPPRLTFGGRGLRGRQPQVHGDPTLDPTSVELVRFDGYLAALRGGGDVRTALIKWLSGHWDGTSSLRLFNTLGNAYEFLVRNSGLLVHFGGDPCRATHVCPRPEVHRHEWNPRSRDCLPRAARDPPRAALPRLQAGPLLQRCLAAGYTGDWLPVSAQISNSLLRSFKYALASLGPLLCDFGYAIRLL